MFFYVLSLQGKAFVRPQRPRAVFRRLFRPLGLVSSRGLRPATALSREGRGRVRVRPRRGRRAALARWQRRVSPRFPTRAPITALF